MGEVARVCRPGTLVGGEAEEPDWIGRHNRFPVERWLHVGKARLRIAALPELSEITSSRTVCNRWQPVRSRQREADRSAMESILWCGGWMYRLERELIECHLLPGVPWHVSDGIAPRGSPSWNAFAIPPSCISAAFHWLNCFGVRGGKVAVPSHVSAPGHFCVWT